MSKMPARTLVIIAIALTASAAAWGQAPVERAAPPSFTEADREPFFLDARDALVGERPAAAADSDARASEPEGEANNQFEWSRVIEGDSLATEVKRIATRVTDPLRSPAAFKSGGNKACRGEFAMLAVLFAVIEEYDGEVRWQREAQSLRIAAARAAELCRTASDQSYAAASRVRDDLDELIRGGRLAGSAKEPLETWSTLADRTLLMRRMEQAMRDGVNARLADAKTLAQHAADVRHEAELLSMLADIIARAEFDYWDDETFVGYAHDLQRSAGELGRAAADGNYEAARAAAGTMTNACASCHDGYRG